MICEKLQDLILMLKFENKANPEDQFTRLCVFASLKRLLYFLSNLIT